MAEATRKFLDYAGLAKFWGIIESTFAKKTETVSGIAIDTAKEDKTKTQDLIVSYADSTTHKDTVTLPAASDTQAGLMSSDHWKTINDLKYNIDQLAPFAGLEIDGKEVSLDGRRANIKLEYASQGTEKAVIRLVDADWKYAAGATWSETTEADYTANKDAITGRYTMVQDKQNGTVKYYKWSANEAGPVNSTGAPLQAKPISEIDVTELVKTGLLKDTDVVVNPEGFKEGTYIKLDFWLHQDADGSGDGAATVKTEYINVTDLIDIYTAGDGISIDAKTNAGMDDTARGVTISLKTATDDEVGGIKTKYTAGEGVTKSYAVKVDKDGNAYVAVPWESISVSGNGDDYITLTVSEKTALGTSTAADPKYNYDIKVAAGASLKKAESYAQTAVQSVDAVKNGNEANKYLVTTSTVVEEGTEANGNKNWGKAVTVDLTADAKASLDLADKAVQTIASAENRAAGTPDLTVDVAYTTKGTKTYTVGLTDETIASLDKADSAIQTITVLNETLDQEHSALTVANAKLDLALGTAAGVNYTADTTLATQTEKVSVRGADGATTQVDQPTVATTAAVKTYVDTLVSDTDSDLKDWVQTEIVEKLDSNLAINTAAPTDGVAYDYQQGAPQQILTNIVIEDGKLISTGNNASTFTHIHLRDVVDFAPLSNDDIDIICGLKQPAN